MRLRILPALFAAWALSYCLPAVAIDGHAYVGIGATLNNAKPYREETKDECGYDGQLVELGIVGERVIGGMDARLSWTYVMCSIFGTEQFVTLDFAKSFSRASFGAGLIVNYTQGYEDWQRDYVPPDPIGPRECTFCGLAVHAAYQWRRVFIEARYLRTDFNVYPGHNGPMVLVAYRF